MEYKKILTMENLNPHVIEVEYAVRGPIIIRAAEIEKEIKSVERFSLFHVIIVIPRANIIIHSIGLFVRILVIVMPVEIKSR